MGWGKMLDCLALTPDQFAGKYVIRPATYETEDGEVKPWNGNAKACKQWLADHADDNVITGAEAQDCRRAAAALHADEVVHAFLEASYTQVLVRGEWRNEDPDIVAPVECLIDLVPRPDTEFASCLGDLKTGRNAALLPWQRFCFSMGYHCQAEFNRALYSAAMPSEDRNTFCFIVQENYEPWQVAKRILSQDFGELGRLTVNQLMADYSRCVASGKWPGYDDHDEAVQGWSVVRPEMWMVNQSSFAPHFGIEDAP